MLLPSKTTVDWWMPICREIFRIAQFHPCEEACREATPDVARARECPPVPNVYPSRTRVVFRARQ
jgi:hypothetical protein